MEETRDQFAEWFKSEVMGIAPAQIEEPEIVPVAPVVRDGGSIMTAEMQTTAPDKYNNLARQLHTELFNSRF